MSRIIVLLLTLNLIGHVSTVIAEPALIESVIAVTDGDLLFEGISDLSNGGIALQVFNLDSIRKIERHLSFGMPANETQARVLVERKRSF